MKKPKSDKKPQASTQKKKRYIALARVSSREQEREGFSLDIQVDALKAYAERQNGTITKLWRIAETASKTDERKTFKELIAYAKKHAIELDGILFYKVDRAALVLFDYVELERLESEFDAALCCCCLLSEAILLQPTTAGTDAGADGVKTFAVTGACV